MNQRNTYQDRITKGPKVESARLQAKWKNAKTNRVEADICRL